MSEVRNQKSERELAGVKDSDRKEESQEESS